MKIERNDWNRWFEIDRDPPELGIAKYKFKKDSIGCRHGAEWMQEGENFRLIFRGRYIYIYISTAARTIPKFPRLFSLIVEYLKDGNENERSREVYLWISLFLPTSFFVRASLEWTKRKIIIRRLMNNILPVESLIFLFEITEKNC